MEATTETLATTVDALLAELAVLAATAGLVAFETIRYREARGEIRETGSEAPA